jgi:hypothetical protein
MDIDSKAYNFGKEINDIQEEEYNDENDNANDILHLENTVENTENNTENKFEKNTENNTGNNTDNYTSIINLNDNSDLMSRITYRPTENNSYKSINDIMMGHDKKNSCGEFNNMLKPGMIVNTKSNRPRRTVFVKKTDKGFSHQIISKGFGVGNYLKHIKTSSMGFLESNISSNPIENEISKKIVFERLTGYPLIQYNLAKVLLQTLSPIDVIDIFLYTFLEKDVLFFSKNLEFLSLTINSYLNLNFPLNDEKYYFINASVSYENYVNENSTFVGSPFTTIIGINDSYNQKYQSGSMNKLREHLAVDLDNGRVYKVEDKNDKEKSRKNKELFNFIKNSCRSRESKNKTNILQREIIILNNELSSIYSNLREDDITNSNVYKSSYIAYDENIKKKI